ncbi:DNA gyrase subunit A [Acinetobacter baumannii]
MSLIKEGMRIAIDLKRGENAEVVVNNLFLNTQLENSFSINMVCLDNGQPKLMNLKRYYCGIYSSPPRKL